MTKTGPVEEAEIKIVQSGKCGTFLDLNSFVLVKKAIITQNYIL